MEWNSGVYGKLNVYEFCVCKLNPPTKVVQNLVNQFKNRNDAYFNFVLKQWFPTFLGVGPKKNKLADPYRLSLTQIQKFSSVFLYFFMTTRIQK